MQIFRLSTAHMKTDQIPCHFSSHKSVFPYILHHLFSVMTHDSFEIFLLKHYTSDKKDPIKVQIFRFLSALMKVHPIPHASFEATSSSFIQILHHRSVSCLLCIFKISNLYTLGKKSPLKWNFQTFEWLGENSLNS